MGLHFSIILLHVISTPPRAFCTDSTWAVHPHGCPSAWLFIRMAVHPHGCSSAWLSIRMAVHPHGCPSAWLFIRMAVHPHGCPSAWLFIRMAVHVYGCSSVWLSMHITSANLLSCEPLELPSSSFRPMTHHHIIITFAHYDILSKKIIFFSYFRK